MITQFTSRLLSSLRRNGFRHTVHAGGRHLATWLSTLIDGGFDRRYHLDTRDFVEIHEMSDVASSNLERGIRYEPTRARPLRRILREFDPPTDGVFVDIGCGKGRVMILAVEHGFRRVVGVDFSPSLCETARANLSDYAATSGIAFDSEVHNADAADFPIGPDYNVVFLYNPFDADVLESVMRAIDASHREHPRVIHFIYHNPLWRHTVESHGFVSVLERSYGGCEFAVYTRGADAVA